MIVEPSRSTSQGLCAAARHAAGVVNSCSWGCRAAVQFEKGAYEECIADCDKAVERGRELRADYKMVAKALTRKGNALAKMDKLADAISTYQKALTEHR